MPKKKHNRRQKQVHHTDGVYACSPQKLIDQLETELEESVFIHQQNIYNLFIRWNKFLEILEDRFGFIGYCEEIDQCKNHLQSMFSQLGCELPEDFIDFEQFSYSNFSVQFIPSVWIYHNDS